MASILEKLKQILDTAQGVGMPALTTKLVKQVSVDGAGCSLAEIAENKSYFYLTLHEMFLTQGRQLWTTFDPLVLIVCEFLYDKSRTAFTKVIGPDLLNVSNYEAPHGFLIKDELAIGPFPYKGGPITISIVLYRLSRQNNAKDLLDVLGKLSGAVSVPTGIATYLRVGEVLVDGVDSLLKLRGTIPLIGYRLTVDDSTVDGLLPFYCPVIRASERDVKEIEVANGRLLLNSGGTQIPMEAFDYLLFSLKGVGSRHDEELFPFYARREEATRAALSGDEESWKRAKATLLSMYGEMLSSPDLIPADVERIFEETRSDILISREKSKNLQALSPAERMSGKSEMSKNVKNAVLDLA